MINEPASRSRRAGGKSKDPHRSVSWSVARTRKKAAVASGPKFREETPKKGYNRATPIAVLQCNIYA
jgi:hypothetical protein